MTVSHQALEDNMSTAYRTESRSNRRGEEYYISRPYGCLEECWDDVYGDCSSEFQAVVGSLVCIAIGITLLVLALIGGEVAIIGASAGLLALCLFPWIFAVIYTMCEYGCCNCCKLPDEGGNRTRAAHAEVAM